MKEKKIILNLAILFVSSLFFSCSNSNNNVQTRIKLAVDSIRMIDTHEHLISEKGRLTMTTDFFYLFKGYIKYDLVSAGMDEETVDFVYNPENPLEERWSKFYPYWLKTKNTANAQYVLIAVKDLYGIDDINEDTYKTINEKVLESNHEGWYNYVLKEKSGIDISILDPLDRFSSIDPVIREEFFVSVKRFDNFVRFGKRFLEGKEKQLDIKINSLNALLNVLDSEFQNAIKNNKIVGIKSGLAYGRILYYADVPFPEAEKLFNKKINTEQKLSPDESKKLQDFMMHQVIGNAEKYDLPVQIHTGILAGNNRQNPISNTNSTNLYNIFLKFPKVKFVIFHGSYPYMAELGVLAKHFPNVYIDMCWMYIISPEASRQYLMEWLLTVPSNKIMAFGGDFGMVEGVYGHSVLARKIVAEVLSEMVMKEYLLESDAVLIANRILRKNALELYKLQKQGKYYQRVP